MTFVPARKGLALAALAAMSCTLSCAQNPLAPIVPEPDDCRHVCYEIVVTVTDAITHEPLKAIVTVDDGADRHTDSNGVVGILVTRDTVIDRLTVSAMSYVTQTVYPPMPAADVDVALVKE